MQELLGPAAVPAGGGRAWLRCSQHDKRRRCGGRRRAQASFETKGLAAGPEGGSKARAATHERQARPIGGRREACGAWPGFETTRRAKLAARTARGRAGLASAGDQAAPQATSHKQESSPTGRHTVFVLISYFVPLFFPSRSITEGKTRDSLKQHPSPTMGTFRCKQRENPGTSMGPGVRWRRMGDSNPRGLAPNTLSKRAP